MNPHSWASFPKWCPRRPKSKMDPRNAVVGEDVGRAKIALRKMRRKLRDVGMCAAPARSACWYLDPPSVSCGIVALPTVWSGSWSTGMSWRSSPRCCLDNDGGDTAVGAVAIMSSWGCRHWDWSSALMPMTRLPCAFGLATGLSWVSWGEENDGPVLHLECLCQTWPGDMKPCAGEMTGPGFWKSADFRASFRVGEMSCPAGDNPVVGRGATGPAT